MTLINPNSWSATWSTSSSAFRPHLKGQMLASTMVYDESVLLKLKKKRKKRVLSFFQTCSKIGNFRHTTNINKSFYPDTFKNPWIPHLVLQISVPSRRPTSAGESSCSSKHSKRPEKLLRNSADWVPVIITWRLQQIDAKKQNFAAVKHPIMFFWTC